MDLEEKMRAAMAKVAESNKMGKWGHVIRALRRVKTMIDHRGREYVTGRYLMRLYGEPERGGWHAWKLGAAMRSNGWRPTTRLIDGRRRRAWYRWNSQDRPEFQPVGRPKGCKDVVKRKPGAGRPKGSRDSKPRTRRWKKRPDTA